MCLLVFFLFVDPHFKLHCLHEGRSACVPAKKRFVVTTERSDCRHRQFLRKFRLFRLEAFSAQVPLRWVNFGGTLVTSCPFCARLSRSAKNSLRLAVLPRTVCGYRYSALSAFRVVAVPSAPTTSSSIAIAGGLSPHK